MNNTSGDALILTLADKLMGNHTDTGVISDVLKLVCDGFSFDCGFIYERDQYNNMNLKEHYIFPDIQLRENFSVDELNLEHSTYLINEDIYYINGSNHVIPFELELLKFFSSHSLVIVPMVDENTNICGLIVLSNKSSKEKLSSSNLKTISVLLHMLGRYVGIRLYQNKLSFAQTSLESILDNTGIDIYVNDFYNHDILYVNKPMAAPYGGIAEFKGKKCWQILFQGQHGQCEFCPQKNLIDEEGNPTKIYSWDYKRALDGSWFRVFSAAFRWVDGRLAHVVSSVDITENKKNEEIIKYMANYDSLTNLPNRRMLVSDWDKRMNKTREDEKVYVLFFDLDGFKGINDKLGHDSGDEFLVKLGEFFTSIPIFKDSIYRNGGDEFVAIIDGSMTKEELRDFTNIIFDRFKLPWTLKKGDVFCNTSIGVACYPEDGRTAEELLYIADQAMYQIKKSGGGNVCFGHEFKQQK